MTGFEWSVGSVSWSPWGGVHLGELEAVVPGMQTSGAPPLMVVEEIRVRPYWGQLLRGNLKVREVLVESPVGDLPLELLATMTPVQKPVQKPVVPEPKPESPPSVTQDPPVGERPPPTGRPSGVPREKKPPEPIAIPDPGPSTRVVVHKGRVRVYSYAAPEMVLELRGASAELPVAGPEASGWLALEGVKLGERDIMGAVRIELDWKQQVLALSKTEFEWNGLPIRVRAQAAVGRRFQVTAEIKVAPTELESLAVPVFDGAQVRGARVEMAGSFRGELSRPATWQGNLVAGGVGLVLENIGKQLAEFEYGRVAVDFRGGVLRLADGRLVSERLSFLGNGAMRWDGQLLGVVRVVGDWEYAEAMKRAAAGSLFSGHGQWMAPLETPDRFYRDVHIEGSLSSAVVDVGRRGKEMDAWQAWTQARTFLRREQGEEVRDEPHSLRMKPMILEQ